MKLPTPAKCCFCIPLRIGLLVIGYLKLVSSLFYIFFAYLPIVEIYSISLMLLFDIISSIIFITAGHKEDVRLYKIYYYCNLVMFALYIWIYMMMWAAVHMDNQIFDTISAIPFLDVIIFTNSVYESIIHIICNVLFQVYLLLLLISQVRKLQEPTKIEPENYIAPSGDETSMAC